ncbi:DUF4840 domain-containing protein [Chryseobacterium limigenitum]|nr:DUF4840 domain-containing protein [Chryseobacterium limigenitum]
MKKLTVLKAFMTVLVAFAALSLTSCNDDKYEPIPVKLEDVNGNYKAKLFIQQGNKGNLIEKIISFSAQDTIITFKDFPIREIVESVIKDPVKTDSAVAKIGKVEYKLNYTSKMSAEQNIVELTFAPKKLSIQIPVDGVTKDAVITVAAKQKGFFVGQDWSLRFGLVAEKIIVDGVELAHFETIKYNFPYSIKN